MALALALGLGACARAQNEARGSAQELAAVKTANVAEQAPPSLHVAELLAPGSEIKPSERVASLTGARVRLVGFVAEMEIPPQDALYLVPQPIHCDEAGGGTADLPLESVLVTLPPTLKQRPEHIPGAVEAIGVLEVGNATDAQGRVSNFRLLLEAPNVQVVARGSAREQNKAL
jgi:hypothetical protein